MKTLQRKLTLIIALSSFFALMFAGVAFVAFDYFKFRDTQVKQLKVLAEVIGVNSIAALDFNDYETGAEILTMLRAVPQVDRAAIYQSNGSLLARYNRDFLDSIWEPPAPESDGHKFEEQFLSLFSSISNSGRKIGNLYLHADLATERARWNRYIIILFSMSIFALLIALVLGYKLQNIITRPIMDLADVAQKVSSEKDYTIRVEEKGTDEIRQLMQAFNDMLERISEREVERDVAEDELKKHRAHLEDLVEERTEALQASNKELEAFSYSVSHDLRAPLRSIHGFSQMLLEDCGELLDEQGVEYIERIQSSSMKMTKLIEALLQLAKITRAELKNGNVNISLLVEEAMAKAQEQYGDMVVDIEIERDLYAYCDENLMSVALDNIISNAWKYSSKSEKPKVSFGVTRSAEYDEVFYIRDNGVGFDMKHAEKIFMAFKRLHGSDDFPGSGVGLATVQRIFDRHGGKIWVASDEGSGTVFYFTLSGKNKPLSEGAKSIFA